MVANKSYQNHFDKQTYSNMTAKIGTFDTPMRYDYIDWWNWGLDFKPVVLLIKYYGDSDWRTPDFTWSTWQELKRLWKWSLDWITLTANERHTKPVFQKNKHLLGNIFINLPYFDKNNNKIIFEQIYIDLAQWDKKRTCFE